MNNLMSISYFGMPEDEDFTDWIAPDEASEAFYDCIISGGLFAPDED